MFLQFWRGAHIIQHRVNASLREAIEMQKEGKRLPPEMAKVRLCQLSWAPSIVEATNAKCTGLVRSR